MIFVSIPLA